MERSQVYKAIDSERKYQNKIWNNHENKKENIHSFEYWCMHIEDHIIEAKHILSRNSSDIANPIVSDIMRKIAAMAVCSMEQHGVKNRNMIESWETNEIK